MPIQIRSRQDAEFIISRLQKEAVASGHQHHLGNPAILEFDDSVNPRRVEFPETGKVLEIPVPTAISLEIQSDGKIYWYAHTDRAFEPELILDPVGYLYAHRKGINARLLWDTRLQERIKDSYWAGTVRP